jgi:hypothetical protein
MAPKKLKASPKVVEDKIPKVRAQCRAAGSAGHLQKTINVIANPLALSRKSLRSAAAAQKVACNGGNISKYEIQLSARNTNRYAQNTRNPTQNWVDEKNIHLKQFNFEVI